MLDHILTNVNDDNPLVSQAFTIKNGRSDLRTTSIQNRDGDNDKTVRVITVV